MVNVDKTVKMDGYDQFKCTADKCRLTCCEGWNIKVDKDTYKKWQENDGLSHDAAELKKCGDSGDYEINKETAGACPFLCTSGLCGIVTEFGDGYLSDTCRTFPRIINDFEGMKEYTLSCACPEAVNIIADISGKISVGCMPDDEGKDISLKSCVRSTLVNIVQQDGFTIYEKLIAGYQMLLDVLESDGIDEEVIIGAVDRYNEASYIERIISSIKAEYGDFLVEESLEEINNFFIDITENYREVEGVNSVIEGLCTFAEGADIEGLKSKWDSFNGDFRKYESLMEKCMAVKIIGSCISDDVLDMAIAYQSAVFEIFLIRYASFIRYCISGNIGDEDVKEYTTVIMRMIGNNAEAFEEFIEEGFDSSIVDMGYLCFAGCIKSI